MHRSSDRIDQRKLFRHRHRRPDEPRGDLGAGIRRQCVEDRLRRAIDQRIAIAHRHGKPDAHADVARGPRHLLRLGREIGQPLDARVVHHHHARAAERAARQRDRAGEIRIGSRRQARDSAARFPAACRRRRRSSSAPCGRGRGRWQTAASPARPRFAPARRLDRGDALAVDADGARPHGRLRGRRKDMRAVQSRGSSQPRHDQPIANSSLRRAHPVTRTSMNEKMT